MIRQVKLSLKFVNKNKLKKLHDFLDKYNAAMHFFLDELWDSKEYKFASQKAIKACDIDITSRAKQAAAKQALGIIQGVVKKYNQRTYKRNILSDQGADTSRLDVLVSQKPKKPLVKNQPAMLDSRFIKFLDIHNSFDLWLKILNIRLPLKKTKMFNKWSLCGKLKCACRLDHSSVTLFFECDPIINFSNRTIGIDVGINSVVTTSDGIKNKSCPHGHTLNSILKKLSNKKKGSKGFKRTAEHRKNFINWSLKQLDLKSVSCVVVEDLKNMRKGKYRKRFLSHFTYRYIFDKLGMLCQEWNVSIRKVDPAYTSQKCSVCGEIQIKNRIGESFQCKKCNNTLDADVNAAINILTSL